LSSYPVPGRFTVSHKIDHWEAHDKKVSSRCRIFRGLMGIGRGLAASPLPHHRTYGSRIRRFGRFSRGGVCTPTGASAPSAPAARSSQMSDLLSTTSPDAISRLHSGPRLLSCHRLSAHRAGLQRRHHTRLHPCRPRVSVPCSFDRQGGFLVRPCGLRLVAVSLLLLCPLLTSPIGSGSITLPSAISDGPWEISQGQTPNVPCIDAGCIKHTPCGWRAL